MEVPLFYRPIFEGDLAFERGRQPEQHAAFQLLVHDIRVDLPDPRERNDAEVRAKRNDLMKIFQQAANSPAESPSEVLITTI